MVTLFFLLFLVAPCVSLAETLEDAARRLAARISSTLAPREAVVLDVRNLSSLAAVDVAAAGRVLGAELAARGVRLAAGSAGAVEVRVTLSENPEGYLWIAEVRRGEAPVIVMVTLPRGAVTPAARMAPALAIRKELVWEQGQQILDVALFGEAGGAQQRMAVLDRGQLSLYERRNNHWGPAQAFPIVAPRPWPRDLRGKLHHRSGPAGTDQLRAVLPGMVCILELHQPPLWTCEESEVTEWRLVAGGEVVAGRAVLAASRNFFTGILRGEGGSVENVAPFFSAAIVEEGDRELDQWIFAGVDGRAALLAGASKLLATFPGWGSDITGIKTTCSPGWQILATRASDWTEPDAMRAYQIREGEAVAVAAPVEFPGPVTALGPLAEGATLAIVRNLRTGRYEAYRISISCGR